ncbi:MAG: hypothetical protein ACFFG0_44490, partial [Candidatus Thorarchaeota archaeon]
KVLILNFEGYKKEEIIKTFNIVKQKLAESQGKLDFLKDQILEKKFLALFSQSINSNTIITKNLDSILISADKNSKILNFYTINLNLIEKKDSFVLNFLNLITSLAKKGFLIFNFTIDFSDIKFSPYFVLESENIEKSFIIEDNINNFFCCKLVKRVNIEIKTIFNYLWRLGIKDNFFGLNDYSDLFNSMIFANSSDFIEINETLERNLIENQIDYMRLNKTLLFIEQSFIFLILENLNSNYIQRLIEKYYSKYSIYLLILNEVDYKELQEIESVKLIDNIKIINPKEIQNINYKEFKTKRS